MSNRAHRGGRRSGAAAFLVLVGLGPPPSPPPQFDAVVFQFEFIGPVRSASACERACQHSSPGADPRQTTSEMSCPTLSDSVQATMLANGTKRNLYFHCTSHTSLCESIVMD
eukprot:5700919-Heterocapsa_arctica.AAC.1